MASTSTFNKLISPYNRERFFNDVFEKKHLVIKGNHSEKFENILTEQIIDDVLSSQRLTIPNTRMTQSDAELEAKDFVLENTSVIDVTKVIENFYNGATLILSQLQDRIPSLKKLCDDLVNEFGQRFQTNIYCTPKNGKQGFNIHHDTHDVFILQIEGSKEWQIYESPINLAIKDQSFKKETHIPGKLIDSFTIKKGDLLYIPRGLMHAAKTSDEKSIHVTLGFMGYTWQDLLIKQLNIYCQNHEILRKGFQPEYWEKTEDYNENFIEIMSLFKSDDFLKEGLKTLHQNTVNRNSPRIINPLKTSQIIDDISLDSKLKLRSSFRYHIDSDSEEMITITTYNKTLEYPKEFLPILKFIFEKQEFQTKDLPLLDNESKIEFIQSLTTTGIIEILIL